MGDKRYLEVGLATNHGVNAPDELNKALQKQKAAGRPRPQDRPRPRGRAAIPQAALEGTS